MGPRTMSGHGDDDRQPTRAFDLAALAREAQPREVTSATFSYVDGMLAGTLSDVDFARIREEILGGAPAGEAESPPAAPPVEVATPASSSAPTVAQIEERMDARDYAGAIQAAERVLQAFPGHAVARRLADKCADQLALAYQRHLGHGFDVPKIAVPRDTLGTYGLDQWGAYVLHGIDGTSTVDELIDVIGLTRLDTLRLLYELVQRGLVVIAPGAPPPAPSSRGDSQVLARIRLKPSR